ncbi:MAG TPA: acyltransferase [Candidatus Woesebacteria bacterium]|nr:acyltransferase [Candidatus Woesebacteria bacterium]
MKKYIFQADVVRCLAIIFAIGVHLTTPITARPDFFGGNIWWLTFLLNCLFRIGVPLFVILSGYLTLGKEISIKQNLQKITKRLLIPLTAFYIIFNLAYILMANLRHENYDYPSIFHNLSINTHSILYFLVVLLFIQLLNPLWNLLTQKRNSLLLKYVCNFFLILAITAYIFYYLSLREEKVFSTFTLWIMWLGFYLYGYVVKTKTEILTKKEEWFYRIIFIVGYTVTVCLGYLILWLFHNKGNTLFYIGGQSYPDSYLSISVVMMSIGAFNLLIRGRKIKKMEKCWIKKPIVFMAGISFALYLLHLLVMDTFNKFFGITPDSPSMPNLPIYLIINTVLTFAVTIPLAFIIKKVPIIKKIVGE